MGLRDTSIALTVKGTVDKALDLQTAVAPLNMGRSIALAPGTGANQADVLWTDTRTAAGNDDIDLAGTLVNAVGDAAVFAKVKAIIVAASAANSGNVIIGNGGTPFVGFFGAGTHTVHVRPGGLAVFACSDATAWAVGAGASDILRIAPSAGSVTYDIVVIGTSA